MSDSRDSRPRVTAPYLAVIDLLPGVISIVISVSSPSDSETINFLTLYFWKNGVSDGA